MQYTAQSHRVALCLWCKIAILRSNESPGIAGGVHLKRKGRSGEEDD